MSRGYRIVCLLLSLSFSSLSNAICDFNSGQYIKELEDPGSIRFIHVDVPKSAKFSRNFAKILVSKTENIPPDLKKKFRANISVEYDFGRCEFEGSVKQNGDWKDHVAMTNGGVMLRSLNVKLKNGNILNAVKFKLLIPDTRNDLNEVLGALMLRSLGFIAPETFLVRTSLNGSESIMLFQEAAEKELLERNGRREGPMFEGDESLIWSYENFENFQLVPLALSRMTNSNWFLKGTSSQSISLGAYSRLQAAYMNASKREDWWGVYPNESEDSLFQSYFAVLLAMNGAHGLANHNKKYYFNTFSDQFEPIYYDGDLSLDEVLFIKENLWQAAAQYDWSRFFSKGAPVFDSESDLYSSFLSRVVGQDDTVDEFFENSLSNFKNNYQSVLLKLSQLKKNKPYVFDKQDLPLEYLEMQLKYGVSQRLLRNISRDGDVYKADSLAGDQVLLDRNMIAGLISNNTLDSDRAVMLPYLYVEPVKYYLESTVGTFVYSPGISIDIDEDNRQVNVLQAESTDWVLLRDGDFMNWSLVFDGHVLDFPPKEIVGQRFNESGMTGCVSFYNVNFSGASINVEDGGCEDGVNIVNSTGEITQILVSDAFADAVDIDFSNLNIGLIKVKNAGNDCIDVSGGRYIVSQALVSGCGDKGISVGEKSFFSVEQASISSAVLGISSKDLSIVEARLVDIKDTPMCFESTRKKQEFGGAMLSIGTLNCEGRRFLGSDSKILVNSQ